MNVLGHIAGGWLVSRSLADLLRPCSAEHRRRLLVVGTLAGTVPDWDYVWYAIKKKKLEYGQDFQHHTWVTHTLPTYWTTALLACIAGRLLGNKRIQDAAIVFAGGTTIHILQDMVGSGDGVMLFYPFSRRMYGVWLSGLHGEEWYQHYVRSPVYLVELALVFLAIMTLLHDLIRHRL